MKRIIALLLAIMMTLPLCACENTDDKETEAAETSTEDSTEAPTEVPSEVPTEAPTETPSETPAVTPSEAPDEPETDPDAAIVTSEHYTLTAAHMQFFLAKVYDDFASQYGDMLSYMLDTSKPLREQACPVDSTGETTWYDYFADGAVTSVKNYLTLAEAAMAAGYELTDGDKALIEGQLSDIDAAAKEKKYDSVEEYIHDYYGSLATKESLRYCFELFILANNYRQHIYGGYTYTYEDYLTYADKNPEECYYADFMYMRLTADIKEDDSDEVKAQKWAELKETAIAFNNACKDKDSFIGQAEKYLRSMCTIVETEEEIDYENLKLTEEALSEAAKSSYTEGVSYATGAPNVDWIFAKGRLPGEQTVIEDEENYACEVIFMIEPMHLAEEPTINVRHILITADGAGSDEKASDKATLMLDSWKKGESTEDSFAELALENTEDTGSAASGGLYENVVPGQMVTEFNDWCFDENRKSGDTDIVKTDYGYHIMYFVSHGLLRWQNTADTALRDAAIDAEMKEQEKKHAITVKDAKLSTLPDLLG